MVVGVVFTFDVDHDPDPDPELDKKGNWPWDVTKTLWATTPPHPTHNLKETYNKKTQRVKVTYNDPLYTFSTKHQVDRKNRSRR